MASISINDIDAILLELGTIKRRFSQDSLLVAEKSGTASKTTRSQKQSKRGSTTRRVRREFSEDSSEDHGSHGKSGAGKPSLRAKGGNKRQGAAALKYDRIRTIRIKNHVFYRKSKKVACDRCSKEPHYAEECDRVEGGTVACFRCSRSKQLCSWNGIPIRKNGKPIPRESSLLPSSEELRLEPEALERFIKGTSSFFILRVYSDNMV
jgi:hypothetical protein